MNTYLKYAFIRSTVFRSIKVALVVGTILALINHVEIITDGIVSATTLFQIVLTYLVPYAVATHAAASQASQSESERLHRDRPTD